MALSFEKYAYSHGPRPYWSILSEMVYREGNLLSQPFSAKAAVSVSPASIEIKLQHTFTALLSTCSDN